MKNLNYLGEGKVGVGKITLNILNLIFALILLVVTVASFASTPINFGALEFIILAGIGITVLIATFHDGFNRDDIMEWVGVIMGASAIILGTMALAGIAASGMNIVKGMLYLAITATAIFWSFASKK